MYYNVEEKQQEERHLPQKIYEGLFGSRNEFGWFCKNGGHPLYQPGAAYCTDS